MGNIVFKFTSTNQMVKDLEQAIKFCNAGLKENDISTLVIDTRVLRCDMKLRFPFGKFKTLKRLELNVNRVFR